MNQLSRKSLIGTLALAVTLSAPLAFAQSTDAEQTAPPTESSTTESTPPTSDSTMQSTTGAEASTSNDASAAAEPAKKSWADVDGDKDGNLSKTEADAVPALSQVFDQADANADGSLTPEEYKTYVAKVQGGSTGEDNKQ
jgi:hypothetical protein